VILDQLIVVMALCLYPHSLVSEDDDTTTFFLEDFKAKIFLGFNKTVRTTDIYFNIMLNHHLY